MIGNMLKNCCVQFLESLSAVLKLCPTKSCATFFAPPDIYHWCDIVDTYMMLIQWSWNPVSQWTSWFQNFKLRQMEWLKRQTIPKHEQKCECNRHTVIFYVKRVSISAVFSILIFNDSLWLRFYINGSIFYNNVCYWYCRASRW